MDRRRNLGFHLNPCVHLAHQQASPMVHQRTPLVLSCISPAPLLTTIYSQGNRDVSDFPRPARVVSRTSTDIVRLLFMVPIYALISFGSYLFWVR